MRAGIVLGLLVCLAAAGQKARQPRPAPRESYPIERIDVRGNSLYTRDRIIAASGLRIGQEVTPAAMNEAVKRLSATGAFEKVEFKFAPGPGAKGYVLTFTVDEAGPVFPLAFEDLGIPDAAAREALAHSDPLFRGERVPATREFVERFVKVLEARLAADGKPQKVAGRLAPDDSGQLVLLFRPAAALPVIARVQFTGNRVIETAALVNAINPTAVGMAYREPRFRQVLDNSVRPLYEARGRVRVSFPRLQTRPDPGVEGLVVTVAVDEGESYSLGEVEVRGATQFTDLGKTAALESGGLFSAADVDAAEKRIVARLRREGYMEARTREDRRIDDAAKKVNVAIVVEGGPRYRFGKLTIDGLDILSEPVIRKMWGLKTGQPFNAEYPDRFLAEVRDQAIFDNLGGTAAHLNTDTAAHSVDVTLVFKGEKKKP